MMTAPVGDANSREQVEMEAIVKDLGEKDNDNYYEMTQRNVDVEEPYEEPPRPRSRNPLSCITEPIMGCVHKIMPPGGIVASAFSLAGGTIGAGILGIPAGSNMCGIVTSMILLIYVTILTIFSLRFLAIAAEKTKIRSFEGLTRWLFPSGHYAFSYFSAFIRWFFSFGCCVGYVISVQDLFKPIFEESLARNPDDKALQYFVTANGRRLIAFIVWIVFMVPLVIPRHIDTLRFASFFAILFMVYFCIIIVIHSCIYGLKTHKNNVVINGKKTDHDGDQVFLFRNGNSAMNDLGTFCFSYICQVNAVEVFWDMRPQDRTVNGFTKAGTLGILICTFIYMLVGIFGYFDFGAEKLATNSMLLMYKPLEEPEVMIAYVGVLVKLIVAYALLHLGSRNSLYYMMGWTEKYREKATDTTEIGPTDPIREDVDNEEAFKEDLKPVNDAKHGHSRTFIDNIPMWRHLIVVIILSGLCLICGLFIPNIQIVFSFAGSICGGFLGFIFPSLILMYSGGFSWKQSGPVVYCMAYILLISGVCAVVFGTGAAIYALI